MKKLTLLGAVAALLLAIPLVASAGVSGPAFYVDGEVYRTVGTPTDFTNTGAPDHSFDTIYQFSGAQDLNVATAAPGDRDYNGGRWMVEVIHYEVDYDTALGAFDADSSGDFNSAEEVHKAIAAGAITTSAGPSFECPVIPMPRGRG